MYVICTVHKDADVVLLSLLLCMHLWLQVPLHCQSSRVVNWSVYVAVDKNYVHRPINNTITLAVLKNLQQKIPKVIITINQHSYDLHK
jgi:hypothetical protein